MTQNNYLGTIGWIKGNLMASSQSGNKYEDNNFYPGSNPPDSEPTRPDGIPPVTDGLVVCVDGNVNNGFANLITAGQVSCKLEGGRNTKSDEHGIYLRFDYSNDTGLKIGETAATTTGEKTYIIVFRAEYKSPNSTGYRGIKLVPERSSAALDYRLHLAASDGRNGPYRIDSFAKSNSNYARFELSDIEDPSLAPHVYSIRSFTHCRKPEGDTYYRHFHSVAVSVDNRHASSKEVSGNGKSSYSAPTTAFNRIFYSASGSVGYDDYKHLYAAYVYDRALSDNELNKVIKYAANRYKITL